MLPALSAIICTTDSNPGTLGVLLEVGRVVTCQQLHPGVLRSAGVPRMCPLTAVAGSSTHTGTTHMLADALRARLRLARRSTPSRLLSPAPSCRSSPPTLTALPLTAACPAGRTSACLRMARATSPTRAGAQRMTRPAVVAGLLAAGPARRAAGPEHACACKLVTCAPPHPFFHAPAAPLSGDGITASIAGLCCASPPPPPAGLLSVKIHLDESVYTPEDAADALVCDTLKAALFAVFEVRPCLLGCTCLAA